MSVSVNSVYQLCYSLAAKQQQAFPSPAEFNLYIGLANIDLFNYYNDERQKELIKVKAGQSLFVPQILSTFEVNNFPMPSASVFDYPPYLSASLPNDYAYDIAFKTPINGVNSTIKKADYDKVETYLNSTVDPPTNANPIYVELANDMAVYPVSVPNPLFLSYLRYPITPIWNYNVVNGVPVYTSVGSVDFEFESSEYLRLSMRVLGYMGISIKDDILAQQAQEMIQSAS